MDKPFELIHDDDDVRFQNAGIYGFKKESVSFWITPHNQPDKIKRVHFELLFDQNPNMSRWIDDMIISFEMSHGPHCHFKLSDIDPKQLLWIGKAFTRIAEFFGDVDKPGNDNMEL